MQERNALLVNEPIGGRLTERPLSRYVMMACLTLSTMITNGLVECHVIYSPIYYQFLSVGITASTAAHIVSLMSTFHAIGRLVSIFEAMVLSTETMILLHLTVSMAALIILHTGQESLTLIYVGNAILGLSYANQSISQYVLTHYLLMLKVSATHRCGHRSSRSPKNT